MSTCATCGEDRFGGQSFGGKAFVCWRCTAQGVPAPPMPEHVMDDVTTVFERAVNEQRHEAGEPPVRLVWSEQDPTRREVWAEMTRREGGLAQAIAAIHREMVGTGWLRPLTRLLDSREAAEAFGVTPSTFRAWLRKRKLRHLTRVGFDRASFREDEVRYISARRSSPAR